MHIGHHISGAGHLGLIGVILFGGVFRADPPPLEVTEVAVFSEAEFAALMRPSQPPESTVDVAAPPAPTLPEDTAAPTPPATDQRPTARPDPVAPPPPEAAPQAPETPQPPPAPEPEPTVEAPEVADRPVPRPADRVASTPVETPEPSVTPAPDTQAAVMPDPQAAPTPDPTPEQEATAPEAATTEIVTEAERPAAARAPERSLRPQARPERPTTVAQETPSAETEQAQTPAPDPEPAPVSTDDAVAAALAAALGGGTTTPDPDLPVGPPLTDGERNALRVAVEACWVVDVGSQAANVTVTIAMSLDQDGRVAPSSLRRVGAEGGDAAAIEAAFQAGRRAILRCQGNGYDLPRDKYDQWKDIEMTFNPKKMRLR